MTDPTTTAATAQPAAERVYDLLIRAGLGKTYGPRRIREIAALIVADAQTHGYPTTDALA